MDGIPQGLADFAPLTDADRARAANIPTGGGSAGKCDADAVEMMPCPDQNPAHSFKHYKHGAPSRTWVYRNAEGAPIMVVARHDVTNAGGKPGKEFAPWTYGRRTWTNGNGEPQTRNGWHCKAPPLPRPLYGLDRLATRPDAAVLVCEGEKTTDAASALFPDVVCVTSQGGSKAPGKSDWTPLRGRVVTIWPDHDKPGADYATKVAELLRAAGAVSVRVVDVPADWPEGWDLADELPDGVAETRLHEMLATAADDLLDADKPAAAKVGLILSPSAPLNSAREFLSRMHTAGNIRTLHHMNGTFYGWKTSHYVELPIEVMRAELYRFLDAAKCVNANGLLKDFEPNKNKVANVLEATAAEAQITQTIHPPAWLDGSDCPNPAEIIACKNYLLHLPTMETQDHTPHFFTLNALDFDYDANAPQPKEWLKFLATVWPDDNEAISTLQEIFGLCLTADTRHQKAFLLVGPPRSGKGTVARILRDLLGATNVGGPTLSGLANEFGLEPLIGKRVAIISDARISGKADQQTIVERLLAITGEDSLTINRKNISHWTGKLDVRFVVLTNELPRLTDSSGALAGRFVTLKMTQSFYGKEDLGLGARLTRELPGILLWAIEGWKRLNDRGYFVPPASSLAAQQELENLGSPVGAFLREKCFAGQGHSVRVDALYSEWCKWCTDQGRDHPGTKQVFGRDLAAAVPGLNIVQRRMPDDTRVRYYEGVALDFYATRNP